MEKRVQDEQVIMNYERWLAVTYNNKPRIKGTPVLEIVRFSLSLSLPGTLSRWEAAAKPLSQIPSIVSFAAISIWAGPWTGRLSLVANSPSHFGNVHRSASSILHAQFSILDLSPLLTLRHHSYVRPLPPQ